MLHRILQRKQEGKKFIKFHIFVKANSTKNEASKGEKRIAIRVYDKL